MKLSIWQQFNSNHSGIFWVVGTFETIENAEKAYKEMRNMLFAIDQWHRDHRPESKAAFQSGNIEPFLPEKEFAAKFQVHWPATIDWSGWAEYPIEDHSSPKNDNARQTAEILIDEAVTLVGRNIIVTNPDQTWMTTQPFEGILAHFGAQTIGWDFEFFESEASDGFEYHTQLAFTAPDAAIADRIEMAIKNYITGGLFMPNNMPPWNDDEQNFQKVLGRSKFIRLEHIEALKKQWQRDYDVRKRVLSASPDTIDMSAKRLALGDEKLKLERNNLHFVLSDLWFHNEGLGVSAFVAWLEVNNCTDIDYRYVRTLDEEAKSE